MMNILRNRYQLILVVLTLAFSAPLWAQEGTVEFVDGDVLVERDGEEFFADFGDGVLEGDVLVTGPASTAVVRLSTRAQVKLRENTRLRIDSLSSNTSATLDSGGVFARVARRAGSAARTIAGFQIRTPTVSAGVRGTEFFVAYGRTVDDEPDLWLCVNEGAVHVAIPSTGQETLVEEGEGISILGGLRATAPRPYAWTRDLNWNFNPGSGPVVDSTSLDGAYTDLLDQDYD